MLRFLSVCYRARISDPALRRSHITHIVARYPHFPFSLTATAPAVVLWGNLCDISLAYDGKNKAIRSDSWMEWSRVIQISSLFLLKPEIYLLFERMWSRVTMAALFPLITPRRFVYRTCWKSPSPRKKKERKADAGLCSVHYKWPNWRIVKHISRKRRFQLQWNPSPPPIMQICHKRISAVVQCRVNVWKRRSP